jgi:hypothetical protein
MGWGGLLSFSTNISPQWGKKEIKEQRKFLLYIRSQYLLK